MPYVGKAIQAHARVFLEELELKEDGSIVPSGVLQELLWFDNVSYNTSSDFQKSGSIAISNPMEKFSTSLRSAQAVFKGSRSNQAETLRNYANTVLDIFADELEFINSDKTEEYEDTSKNPLIDDPDYFYGIFEKNPNKFSTEVKETSFILAPMQRVWILTHSTGLGYGQGSQERFNIWAGIVAGFQETFSSEGETTLTVTLRGLNRFLDLTDVFANYRLEAYQGTLLDKYAQVLKKNLYSRYSGLELLTTLPIVSYVALPLFLANYYYTQAGNEIDYDFQIKASVNSDFFHYYPIWKLNTDLDSCWRALEEGYDDLGFGKARPYQLDGKDALLDLWEGREVQTWEMLPSFYVDPLLIELFNDTSLKVMQQKIQKSFSLSDDSTSTAKDIIVKAAQAIMASAYEDDFGNIIMEAPQFWSAPDNNGGLIASSYYESSDFARLLKDSSHNYDYVIPDSLIFSSTKSFDESNIVTYVETPANYQKVNNDEYFQTRFLTGRLNANDPVNLNLQRRFGTRSLTTTPIVTNKINLGAEDLTSFQKALTAFAESSRNIRNYSSSAASLDVAFLHWLQVNKNLLWLGDEALWFISDKSVSYSNSGAVSCNFTISLRHRLSEHLGYPFLDLYIMGNL